MICNLRIASLDAVKKQQIKQVLLLLVAAMTSAVLLAGYMIGYYGPSGRYLAGNTMLAPAVMQRINEQSTHSKKRGEAKLIFDQIEFSYFDKGSGQRYQIPLSLEQYEQFYNQVAAEKSIVELTPEISQAFANSLSTNLTVSMHNDLHTTQQAAIFQMIQFVESDYFRVQLLGEKNTEEWAYFYHPSILQDVMSLFTKREF